MSRTPEHSELCSANVVHVSEPIRVAWSYHKADGNIFGLDTSKLTLPDVTVTESIYLSAHALAPHILQFTFGMKSTLTTVKLLIIHSKGILHHKNFAIKDSVHP